MKCSFLLLQIASHSKSCLPIFVSSLSPHSIPIIMSAIIPSPKLRPWEMTLKISHNSVMFSSYLAVQPHPSYSLKWPKNMVLLSIIFNVYSIWQSWLPLFLTCPYPAAIHPGTIIWLISVSFDATIVPGDRYGRVSKYKVWSSLLFSHPPQMHSTAPFLWKDPILNLQWPILLTLWTK